MKKIFGLVLLLVTFSCSTANRLSETKIIKLDLDDGEKIEKIEENTKSLRTYLINIVSRMNELEEFNKNLHKREVLTLDSYLKGKYELTLEHKNKIDAKLSDLKGKEIEIIGYADLEGNETFNLNLGLNRAKEVKKYLESKGIKINRVSSSGYNLIVDNKDNAKNRRVEIIIR